MGKEPTSTEVSRLSGYQRGMLIAHIDGAVDVTTHGHHHVVVRNSLMSNGMLRGETPGGRPRATVLTERGRMALAMVLGDYADALIRAGLLDQERPIEVLARIKARAREALLPARMAAEVFRK